MSLRKSQPILYCSHERNILPLTTEMKKKSTSQETSITRSSAVEYLTFIAAKGEGGVEAIYEDENIWLSQKMMAALYNVDVRTINYHLQKIFKERELEENSVIRKFRITATDGKSYHTGHYNLSATIAVGYKVNSERAVQFRKWATTIVKEYTVKGFAMDDERLKAGGTILTEQYFEEQLQRVFHHFAVRGGKAAIPGINQQEVKSVDFLIPNKEVRLKFNEFTQPIFEKVLKSANQSRMHERLWDTLLPKLISGELRIPGAERQTKEALA